MGSWCERYYREIMLVGMAIEIILIAILVWQGRAK